MFTSTYASYELAKTSTDERSVRRRLTGESSTPASQTPNLALIHNRKLLLFTKLVYCRLKSPFCTN